jgi:phosphoglycerol geranylgeranyltransferase
LIKTVKMLLETIQSNTSKKCVAVLLDPDKLDVYSLSQRIEAINKYNIDYVFVGGSLITSDKMDWLLTELKAKTSSPKIIFPGHGMHINEKADGILLLSLISGRNAEFLIGQHVVSAPILKRSSLDILPVGYMLIDGGKPTTVSYISNTTPIPADKPDVAAATAIAGTLLGLKMIYLDAGSGAQDAVRTETIAAVKKNIETPLIVGGGINTVEKAQAAWQAGADIIVIGNAIENNPEFIKAVVLAKNEMAEAASL